MTILYPHWPKKKKAFGLYILKVHEIDVFPVNIDLSTYKMSFLLHVPCQNRKRVLLSHNQRNIVGFCKWLWLEAKVSIFF